jgi:hypothetical protein
MTGAQTFTVTPFVYFTPIGSAGEDMDISLNAVVGYGFTDRIDVFANLANLNLKSEPGAYGQSWVMPRYNLGKNNILALQVGVTQNANNDLNAFGGPHYHFFWENNHWGAEFNAMAIFTMDTLASNSLYACAAPVYKLMPNILYPYVEFDPTYTLGDNGGFDFVIAPGLWFSIPDTPHQLSVSVPLSGIKDGSVGAGIYARYWFSFGASNGNGAEKKE